MTGDATSVDKLLALIEPTERAIGRILRQLGLLGVRGQLVGEAQRRRAAEHHEVDQRIGAEAVGAMHRDAGGFADRHQARHH